MSYICLVSIIIYHFFLSGIVDHRLDFLDEIRTYMARLEKHRIFCGNYVEILRSDFLKVNERNEEYTDKVINIVRDFKSTNLEFGAIENKIADLRDSIESEPFYKSILRSNKEKDYIVKYFKQTIGNACEPCLEKLKNVSEYFSELDGFVLGFENRLNQWMAQ